MIYTRAVTAATYKPGPIVGPHREGSFPSPSCHGFVLVSNCPAPSFILSLLSLLAKSPTRDHLLARCYQRDVRISQPPPTHMRDDKSRRSSSAQIDFVASNWQQRLPAFDQSSPVLPELALNPSRHGQGEGEGESRLTLKAAGPAFNFLEIRGVVGSAWLWRVNR